MKAGRISWLLIVAALGTVAGLLAAAGATPAGAATGPTVTADTRIASPGELVHVTGGGWSPVGDTVLVQLCGQDAADLSSDCDETNVYNAAIRTGGTFFGALTVQAPPAPCPCVVLVTDHAGQSSAVPVQIVGAPVVPVTPAAPPPAPATVSAGVSAPVSVSSWFGGPKQVTVVVRLTNVSGATFSAPVTTVTVGRGTRPTQWAAGRSLAAVPPGASRIERIPVTIPAPTFGRYTVLVQVGTGLGSVTTSTTTSSWPWGWLVVVVLVVVLVVWRMRRRARRRPTSGPEVGGAPVPDRPRVAVTADEPGGEQDADTDDVAGAPVAAVGEGRWTP